ncbi:MAG: N,N-dimethylformamidase beta subunit family domain-containing protein, partial [Burkholderiales bacterium]
AGALSNTANLVVNATAPTIGAAFAPSTIVPGGASTITFTLGNPNTIALSNAKFTDTLTNMSVSSSTIGGTCGGTSNSPALAVGATALNLTVPSLPVAGCTITVQVTSSTVGSNPNTTSGVTSTQTPTAGALSNTANLVVNATAPTIGAAFLPATIASGGTSTITFTLTNPNTTALTGARFSDTLTNMAINAAGAAGGTCTGASGNTFTAGQTGLINFTGLTIPGGSPSGGCTVTVVVTSSTFGSNPNTTSGVTTAQTPTPGAPAPSVNLTVSVIKSENAKTPAQGVTSSWGITNQASNHEIEGYASAASVARGRSINFYVNTNDPINNPTYTLDVFRLGWYKDAGGRRMLLPVVGVGLPTAPQPPCPVVDAATSLQECNWNVSYTLPVPNNVADPTDWASGYYLARLTGSSGKQANIRFVVRDDNRTADLMMQASVTTQQAYNNWGGKSLYDFNSTNSQPATKVSFNRPFIGSFPDQYETRMLRFLEKEGYDVVYSTNLDTHT